MVDSDERVFCGDGSAGCLPLSALSAFFGGGRLGRKLAIISILVFNVEGDVERGGELVIVNLVRRGLGYFNE